MSDKEHRDIADIRAALGKRRDIYLFPRASTPPDGTAPIIGFQLRRVIETEVRAPDSYNPFTYRGYLYYSQAFAVDKMPKAGGPSKDQSRWAVPFTDCGGIYIAARDMRDVIEALGNEPEDVENYLNRIKLRQF